MQRKGPDHVEGKLPLRRHRFEIAGRHSKTGECHCSLCRKVSGVGATAKIVLAFDDLRWVSGEDLVATFVRPSGYGSAFCRVCGSPAPDSDDGKTMVGVPVGLLDGDPPCRSVITAMWHRKRPGT